MTSPRSYDSHALPPDRASESSGREAPSLLSPQQRLAGRLFVASTVFLVMTLVLAFHFRTLDTRGGAILTWAITIAFACLGAVSLPTFVDALLNQQRNASLLASFAPIDPHSESGQEWLVRARALCQLSVMLPPNERFTLLPFTYPSELLYRKHFTLDDLHAWLAAAPEHVADVIRGAAMQSERQRGDTTARLLEFGPQTLYSTFQTIRRSYPLFNLRAYGPADLATMIEREGLEIINVRNLPFRSGLVLVDRPDRPLRVGGYILLREEGLHPLERAFLIAHELGHWFLHVVHNRGDALEFFVRHRHVFFSSFQANFGLLEQQADLFALLALYPTFEITWQRCLDGLSPDALLRSLCREFSVDEKALPDHVRREALHYARRRIDAFDKFAAQRLSEVTFPRDVIRLNASLVDAASVRRDLGWLINWYDAHAWGILDANGKLVETNDRFAALLRTTREALIGGALDNMLASEILDPAWLPRAWKLLEDGKQVSYFLVYRVDADTWLPAMLYAIPLIAPDGTLLGSFGVVMPRPAIDGREAVRFLSKRAQEGAGAWLTEMDRVALEKKETDTIGA